MKLLATFTLPNHVAQRQAGLTHDADDCSAHERANVERTSERDADNDVQRPREATVESIAHPLNLPA